MGCPVLCVLPLACLNRWIDLKAELWTEIVECTKAAQGQPSGERGERRSGQRAGPLAARAWHAVAISGPFVCCEKVQKDQINYARKNFSDAKESQASATSHDSRPAPQRPATLLNLLLLRPWRRAKLLHTPTASIPLLALREERRVGVVILAVLGDALVVLPQRGAPVPVGRVGREHVDHGVVPADAAELGGVGELL